MDELIKYSVTLFCSGDKLRVSSIYQLLIGKRTSSVLTFGYFHHILAHFGLFPKLKETQFNDCIALLDEKGFIKKIEKNIWQITEKGKVYAKKNPVNTDYLDGVNFSNMANEFIDLLFFATQIISEYSYNNKDYLPIIDNSYKQHKIKQWFKAAKNKYKNFNELFYNEWELLLKEFPPDVAAPTEIIDMLSGHQKIGKTFKQITAQQKMGDLETYLKKVVISHFIIKKIITEQKDYPLFTSIFEIIKEYTGNYSAKYSYQLFLEYGDIEKVMEIRNLKKSTIVDHILEGLILSDNSINLHKIDQQNYVFLSDYYTTHSDYKEWVFKDLKYKNDDLCFFSFRAYQILKTKELG